MSLPIPLRTFVDTGAINRECENFQNFVFENLNFKELTPDISFFRSDFRGAKLFNVQFFKNNFDRADFINSFLKDTSFEECNFGTDFTTTLFTSVNFAKNLYEACDLYKCIFINCNFFNDLLRNTTNRKSSYISCQIIDCKYEMNSFNDVSYEKCTIRNTSFAEMAAYNLSFDRCIFEGVAVDPDNLGSYLIKNSRIEDLQLIYRGKEFQLSGNIIEDINILTQFYYENKRYHEALNTKLMYLSHQESRYTISPYLKELLADVLKDDHYLRKLEQLNKIIKIIAFYYDSNVLSAKECFYAVGIIDELPIQFSNLKDRLEFMSNLFVLKEIIEKSIEDFRILNEINLYELIYAEIELSEDDLDKFEVLFQDFYKSAIEEFGWNELKYPYQIVGIRKGSIILEVVGYAVGLFVLATIAKSIISKTLEVRMEFSISRVTSKLLDSGDSKKLREWEEKVKIARRIQEKPSNELFTKAKALSDLMKRFQIFPNAVFKGPNES